MRFMLAALQVPVLLLVASCATGRFDPITEERRLLERDAEWASAASAGKDIDKIVSYWSDDALVIPPGQPVLEGKSAIRAFVAASLQIPGFNIHWASQSVKFSPDGHLAYMRSTNTMTVPGPSGPMKLLGRAVTVWRLDPDGQWRCVVDIWNDAPTTAPPPK